MLLGSEEVRARVARLELPFNAVGVDPYGISREHLVAWFTAFGWFYRTYFDVKSHGVGNVPARGRAMVVGNHCGGIATDGAMVIASLFFEPDPPRLAQGMAEKFLNRFPLASLWTARVGQFTGLPEQAERLLRDERLLMVFPEGARGTAKLYKERNSLVEFGTGFVRLAMRAGAPIVPCGFTGGGDAIPTIANLYKLGQMFGVPYVPVTPWLLPLPRPVKLEIHYGPPLRFSGTGDEDDATIQRYVDEVKVSIASLMERGRQTRRERLGGSR